MAGARGIAIQDVLALVAGQVRALDAQVAQALVAVHQLVQDALDAQAHAVEPARVRDAQVVRLLAREPQKALGVPHAAMTALVHAERDAQTPAKILQNNLATPVPKVANSLVHIHAQNLVPELVRTHATWHVTELVQACVMGNVHIIAKEVLPLHAVHAIKVVVLFVMAVALVFACPLAVACAFRRAMEHAQA